MKALNERISEWAHFLNLAKRFQRYLNFDAPENTDKFVKIDPKFENKSLFDAKFFTLTFGVWGLKIV